ncbi:MAG: HAD family phosphatase [Rhodococcus fascians]|uniref:HAD family hydrolase n=1 Tax=Nocardiaceae TaxID=85025 RepID=UPI00036E9C9E|nr:MULTISPECIES: HAD family phosphatase [Rhodococcus]OZC53849.1 HAD family phosphatase [Rhodococcus sp. 06-621-2]OZC89248.1 HAD family phosphatase [Rhodococcus sp. 06-418-1B]OZD05429.1 HAD family phosphatase [Rhodococcus sp. 06-156-4C]OZD16541.1 HAD family phosphatase [Rhodococcus sp. 06-156-4a]OZD26399.1 HAD family phosphatase [Rhodococcus sp. 06-156-3C]
MSDNSSLQGVLWDMDGTLLDSEKIWDVAVAELSVTHGRELTPEVRESTLGNSMRGALTKVFVHTGTDVTEESLAAGRDWLTARVSELFAEGIPWRPGAKDALALARDIGLRTALVTNTERGLVENALDTIGREYFDFTVSGDEVDEGKPHPAPYLKGAALLGLDPSQCLAVEDSPTGSLSAHRAGCSVLLVPSEVAVAASPGYVVRESLVGLTADDLRSAWCDARRPASS